MVSRPQPRNRALLLIRIRFEVAFPPAAYIKMRYFSRFFASQHRFQYVISTEAIIDLITILPLFFTSLDTTDRMTFQSVTVIFRSLRLTRILNKVFKIGETEVSQQIFKIFLTILTLLFVTAGVLQAFENPVRETINSEQFANLKSK